ncbi:N-acetylglucosamine-6-phosphate deacetylase [Salisediminibacterium halotolerans]|uniref:N-acetylglucosamine-6-phosphate deacetylase n=1 Tax=Salisediminibacterium halotolerans TaxID=517425 RepID=A0A1H9SLZ0_9BACI|nr:N-acetylglucosamine-6-phosphate deacetylase [Salisediminibacterium haloalkalitolerans]SER85735.1 N-acetylglucosamine-6-phosphate deacetylase [Salisediminibacterium haloalkalitolerans]
MTEIFIEQADWLIGENWQKECTLTVQNGTFKDIQANKANAQSKGISFGEPVHVVPGFIDVHIHGTAGADVMDGEAQALETMRKALLSEGTTSFLPTTITQSIGNKHRALQTIKETMTNQSKTSGAEIIGVHLEGPFINKVRAGAQPEQYIIEPDMDLFRELQQSAGGSIKIVTYAPEKDEKGFGNQLMKEGVIASPGHTDASYEDLRPWIESGGNHMTHMFNQMRGVHHRDIGTAGTGLLSSQVKTELIADGIHVSPPAIELLYKNKGADGIILITDSIRAKGMKDGHYQLGGQDVTVSGKEATLADGTLAGSILPMNEAVKNMMAYTGCTLAQAVRMATVNPAEQLEIADRKGSIAVGKEADFTVLSKQGDVLATYIGGEEVFRRNN